MSEKCYWFREIRREIAKRNAIPYNPKPCERADYDYRKMGLPNIEISRLIVGSVQEASGCYDTCAQVALENKYIEAELNRRKAVGKTIFGLDDAPLEYDRNDSHRITVEDLISSYYRNRCGHCGEEIGTARYCRYCGTERGKGEFVPMDNIPVCIYGPPPVKRTHTCKVCNNSYSAIITWLAKKRHQKGL